MCINLIVSTRGMAICCLCRFRLFCDVSFVYVPFFFMKFLSLRNNAQQIQGQI